MTKCPAAMKNITNTDLGEVIDKGEMCFLQLCPGQCGQRVWIVQLFAVV